MNFIDFVWIIIWFLAGLLTFQYTSVKKIVGTISGLISFISLIALITKPDSLVHIFSSIGLGYISGLFTTLSYLIGANISRYMQFGRMSPRILLYPILLIILWIVLESVF